MQTQAETTRATLARVVGLLVGVVVAGLCALRALGDAVAAAGAAALSATWERSEHADLTPFLVSAVVWAVLAAIAAVLAYVVLKPGRSRRATTLAAIGIAVLATGYVVDVFVVNPPTSF